MMLCYYCYTAITSANACVSYHLALLVEINNCSAHLSVRHKRQTVRNGISQNKNIDVTGRDTVHAASCMQDASYSYVWQRFICIYLYTCILFTICPHERINKRRHTKTGTFPPVLERMYMHVNIILYITEICMSCGVMLGYS